MLEPNDKNKTVLEIEYECLETCLKKLSGDQHQFTNSYCREEKSAGIGNGRELTENLEMPASLLQVKAFRIRARLKDFLGNCITEISSR